MTEITLRDSVIPIAFTQAETETVRDSERRSKQTVSTRAHRSGAEENEQDGLYPPTKTAPPPPTAGRQPQPRVLGAAPGNRGTDQKSIPHPRTSPSRPTTTSIRQQAFDASVAQVESELESHIDQIEQLPQGPAGELDDMETTSTSSSPTTAFSDSISDADEEVQVAFIKQEVERFLTFVHGVLPKEPSVTLYGDNYRTWRKAILRDAAKIESERLLLQRDPPPAIGYVDTFLWEYKNDILYSCMQKSMFLPVIEDVGRRPIDSAAWLWNKLELMYGGPDNERRAVLNKLMGLKIKDGLYSDYLLRFDHLVTRLRKLGYSLPEWMVHDVYIMGLGDYCCMFDKDNWEDVRRDVQMVIENNLRFDRV
ncbi:hypothetical protein PHISP_06252 [Aspergillus sp. HF37]|nr:hypothetical protein PHISP_06252 [Aspergillus sp. HF37]